MDNFETFARTKLGTLASLASRLLRGHGGHDLRDSLVQVGMVGLWSAYQKLDPGRADTFESYAMSRARGAMLDELRASGPRKRLAQEAWEDDTWSARTPWAILEQCPLFEADGVRALDDPEEQCQGREDAALVRRLLLSLPARHQQVVKRYYFDEAEWYPSSR